MLSYRPVIVDRQWKTCDSIMGQIVRSFPLFGGIRVNYITRWTNRPTSHGLYATFTQRNTQANLENYMGRVMAFPPFPQPLL